MAGKKEVLIGLKEKAKQAGDSIKDVADKAFDGAKDGAEKLAL